MDYVIGREYRKEIYLDVWVSQYELPKRWIKSETMNPTSSGQNKLQNAYISSNYSIVVKIQTTDKANRRSYNQTKIQIKVANWSYSQTLYSKESNKKEAILLD